MGTARFCELCGSALEAGDKFCMKCGHPVEATPQPSPSISHPASTPIPQVAPAPAVTAPTPKAALLPAPAPRAAATPAATAPVAYAPQQAAAPLKPAATINPLLIAVAVIVLAGLGGGTWWFIKGRTPATPAANKPPATSTSGPVNTPTPVKPPAGQPGEDFIGRWYPDTEDGQESDEILTIKREGNLLVGTGKDASSGRLEFPAAAGQKLTGALKQAGTSIPATVEILSDKKKMVLTVAPPNSEYQTAIFWRDTGAPPDTPGIEKITSYTEDQARNLVAQQPEVAQFIKDLAVQKKKVHIDVAPEDAGSYSVHVYEVVDDGDGMAHTATFAWYKVDRKTGKVSPGM